MGESFEVEPSRSIASLLRAYAVPIALGSVSVITAGIAIVLLVKSTQSSDVIQFSEDAEVGGVSTRSGEFAHDQSLVVDISGAVLRPGVYRLSPGARVEEVLIKAGGFVKDADMQWVGKQLNRAMKIRDGMKLYIPFQGEDEMSHINDVAQSSYSLTDTVMQIASMSINNASQSELESLPGVGPVTAQKIIDNRPYMNIQDLLQKKVMGQALFEKLKSYLML
jgi:competence protein ComEA